MIFFFIIFYFLPQTCRYDPLRREEYLAVCRRTKHETAGGSNVGVDREAGVGSVTAAAAGEQAGLRQRWQQGEGDEGAAGGPDSIAVSPALTAIGVGCDSGRVDCGDGGGGGDGGSDAPFARLRERTFEMTKRGELTSANVWYAAMRKERGVTIAGGGGGGGSSSSSNRGTTGSGSRTSPRDSGGISADGGGGGGATGDDSKVASEGGVDRVIGGETTEGGEDGSDYVVGAEGVELATPI